MNEHELRDAFRGVMVASSPPPPMDTTAALEVARRTHRRRRATLAGAATALAVVAITVTAVVAPGWSALRGGQVDPAGPPGRASVSETPRPTALPPSAETKTVWPTGPDGKPQQDRTAYAGPRHDQAARLLDELVAVVPPGYTVPTATNPSPTDTDAPDAPSIYWSRTHQAEFADRVDGVEVWEYLASLSISQGERTGRLLARVHTPRNGLPGEPCELTRHLGGLTGECQVMNVGDNRVGVVTRPTGDRIEFDQWAAYRYSDDTVVFIAQSKQIRDSGPSSSGLPPLESQPFTPEQLAQLAVDPRFHLE